MNAPEELLEKIDKILKMKEKIRKIKIKSDILEVITSIEDKAGDNEWVIFGVGDIEGDTFICRDVYVPEQESSYEVAWFKFSDIPDKPFIIIHKHPCPWIHPSKTDLGWLDILYCFGLVIYCGGCFTDAYNGAGYRLSLEDLEIY